MLWSTVPSSGEYITELLEVHNNISYFSQGLLFGLLLQLLGFHLSSRK